MSRTVSRVSPSRSTAGPKTVFKYGRKLEPSLSISKPTTSKPFCETWNKKTNLARVKKDQQNTKNKTENRGQKIHWSKWELLHLKLSTFLIEIELLMTCFSAITIIVKYFIKWKTTLFLFILIKWESGHVWKIWRWSSNYL